MQSKFISGLFSAEKDTLATFIAMWDESTITTILMYKSSDTYEKVINKKDDDAFSKKIENKTKQYKEMSVNELQIIIVMQLSSYFEIKLPKTFNLHSLDEIGMRIENEALKALNHSDKEFTGKTTDEMIKHVFEKLFQEMTKLFKTKDNKTKEEIVENILSSIEKMSEEEKNKLKEILKVDKISADVIRKALAAGTLGTAFATLISVAGFSAYTAATAALASLAALIGVTFPFGTYMSLTSIIAVLADPLFLLTGMTLLLYGLNKKSNSSIRNGLSPMIVSLISILSSKFDDYSCKCEKYMHTYNELVFNYAEANEAEKERFKKKILGLKEVKFEGQSVFNLTVVPSSLLATCDNNMRWLNNPVKKTSIYDKLKRYFDNTYDTHTRETNLAMASLTIGDLIYDMSRIDPLVIESVDFARKEEIIDKVSFAYFAEKIDLESTGDISQLKGYVAERLIAQQLQSQGYEIEFPPTSNQPGYDLLVNNQPFQVKCGESNSLVSEHFDKYPNIPVLVNEELGESFIDNEMVFSIEGIRNDAITELTKNNLEAGSDLLDYEIPLLTLAVVSGKNIFQVFQNKIDLENAIGKTVEESTIRMTGAFAGSNLLMIGGMVWMPAAGVVGGVVGAVLGSMTIASLVDKLKLTTLLKDESDAIDNAIKVIMTKAILIAEKNLETAEKKFGKTVKILKERGEEYILRYLEYRYKQESTYRIEKITLMKKVKDTQAIILDEDASNILVSAQNALVLTEQAGVHPYNLQTEVSILLVTLNNFNEAMSTSEVTKKAKEILSETELVEKITDGAKIGINRAKSWINKSFK